MFDALYNLEKKFRAKLLSKIPKGVSLMELGLQLISLILFGASLALVLFIFLKPPKLKQKRIPAFVLAISNLVSATMLLLYFFIGIPFLFVFLAMLGWACSMTIMLSIRK